METINIPNSYMKNNLKKSKSLICLFVILCISTQSIFGTTNIWVKPYEIKFNFEPGQDDDALTIRDDDGEPAPIPEWKYSPSRSNNFAYIKSQTDRKIKVKFDSNCSDMHLIINLTVTSGTGIGEVCNHVIMNYEDLQEVTLTIDGTIPNNVDVRQFTWKWEIYAITNESGYCSALSTNYTTHTYYTLLTTPQAPMAEPWSSVLDYACDWASGQTTEFNVVTKITEGAYNNLGKTYTGSAGTHAPLPYFNLTSFLNQNWVDCRDMSAVVQVFTNALGGSNIMVRSVNYYSGSFTYKPIRPIGWTIWTDEDDWPDNWNFHQFGYLNNVFDACLKLKKSSPRIPVNEPIDWSYKTDLYQSGSWVKDTPTLYTIVY